MESYEVVWRIEVEANSEEDAAKWVNDHYLKPCESGDWTYEVARSDNLSSVHLVTVRQ